MIDGAFQIETALRYAVDAAVGCGLAAVGLWTRTLHKAIGDADARAVRGAELAGGVKDQLAAHKLFVAENYTSKTALRETEERIGKQLEDIQSMLRQLVATRARNAGE